MEGKFEQKVREAEPRPDWVFVELLLLGLFTILTMKEIRTIFGCVSYTRVIKPRIAVIG